MAKAFSLVDADILLLASLYQPVGPVAGTMEEG